MIFHYYNTYTAQVRPNMNEFKGVNSTFEQKSQEQAMCLRQDPYDFTYKQTQVGMETISRTSDGDSVFCPDHQDPNSNDGKRTEEKRSRPETDEDDIGIISDNEEDTGDRGEILFVLLTYM